MNYSVAIVGNSRPAYIASPIYGDGNDVEIDLEPVVAWRIEYSEREEGVGYATPISAEPILPSKYAIYYSDTDRWSIADNTLGTGLHHLKEHFINDK